MSIIQLKLLHIRKYWKTMYITNYMEHSPSWKANSRSASQDVCLLWWWKVHYCVHKGLPLASLLNHMNPVRTFPLSFSKIQSNILPSTPMLKSITHGAIPPLPQYAFIAWCSVKPQGHLYIYTYVFHMVSSLQISQP